MATALFLSTGSWHDARDRALHCQAVQTGRGWRLNFCVQMYVIYATAVIMSINMLTGGVKVTETKLSSKEQNLSKRAVESKTFKRKMQMEVSRSFT